MADVATAAAADDFDGLQHPFEPVSTPQGTPQRKGSLAFKVSQQQQPQHLSFSPPKQRTSSGTPSTMSSTFYSRPYRSEDEADDEKKEESCEPPPLRLSRSEIRPPKQSSSVKATPSNNSSISSKANFRHNNNNGTKASQGTSGAKKSGTGFRKDDEEDNSQPPSLRTSTNEYKDPFFESPHIGKGQSNASAASAESSAAAELGHHQQQPQQKHAPGDPPTTTSPNSDPETLLKIHMRSSIYGTTAFYLPVSLLLAREKEMKQAAQNFGITSERWSASLLYRTYQLRHQKHQYSAISFVSENSEWRTIELDPETECAQSNFSHSLTWEPWLTACIRAYYNTGSIRIPDECIGSDILLALEYFGIVYAPDQLVFDSFGAYLRVKLWSDYFTHRASLADWVVQKMLKRSVARHLNAFCTCPSEEEMRFIFHVLASPLHAEKRLEVFDGGLTLDPVKYDRIPSCAVVHDFFTDTTSSADSASTPGVQLDALMRDDFRAYLQTSLPGTQILFEMEQIQITNPAIGQTETKYRAVLHIDILPPPAKAISPPAVPPQPHRAATASAPKSNAPSSQPVPANTSAFSNAKEAFDAHNNNNNNNNNSHRNGPIAHDEPRAGVVTPVESAYPTPPQQQSRNTGAPSLHSSPSKDTQGSIDDEVAQLTLPKSNSMFVPTQSREELGGHKGPPHASLSLPNAQSYDEKILRKQQQHQQHQQQQQHQQKGQQQRVAHRDVPKQEPVHRNAPLPTPQEDGRRNAPSQQIARRVGAGVELRPTPSVDHIYIELGTDPQRQHQSRLPPRSPRTSPNPRSGPVWNDAQAAAEQQPSHSRRKPTPRKSKKDPRYGTDTEDSLFHMSDTEADPRAPVGVVVAARGDLESVASTLSGPLTVEDWPTLNHARSFSTPVDTLSVAEKERVPIQRRPENHRKTVPQPAPNAPMSSAHLAELQQLSSVEQEDFYRWQQRQLQRRRLQQQQEEQQRFGKFQDTGTATPASTPDRSSSLFTQQSLSACQNVAWLDYLCEAMNVPGSEEIKKRKQGPKRMAQPRNAGAPINYWEHPPQITPTSSTDETSSPAVVVPQVRRNITFPENDPSPSTAWIADAFNFVRSVFEGDGSLPNPTVPQENMPIRDPRDDHVIRARSPTLVVDRLERTAHHLHPGEARQQPASTPVGAKLGPKDWDDDDDDDKYRTFLNEGEASPRQKRVSFDQRDTQPVVLKAKSWSQPFHIVAGQEPSKGISPRNNPRTIPLRERPPIDKKTLPKGKLPNQRPQSAPRPAMASQPQSDEKGEKKRGVGLKGLFGFRRKKNVATT